MQPVSFDVVKLSSSHVSVPHDALSSNRSSLALPDAVVALTTVSDALLSSASP